MVKVYVDYIGRLVPYLEHMTWAINHRSLMSYVTLRSPYYFVG